jgi:hypothetical protein
MARGADFCRFKEISMSTAEGRPMTVDPALASAAVAAAGDAIVTSSRRHSARVTPPASAPAGAVAVLRRADASLVPFGTPMAE